MGSNPRALAFPRLSPPPPLPPAEQAEARHLAEALPHPASVIAVPAVHRGDSVRLADSSMAPSLAAGLAFVKQKMRGHFGAAAGGIGSTSA